MRPHVLLLAAFASAALAPGCAPVIRADIAPAAPAVRGWKDAGTPKPSVELEREVRYYKDEKGEVWDDRGRRHPARPGA